MARGNFIWFLGDDDLSDNPSAELAEMCKKELNFSYEK